MELAEYKTLAAARKLADKEGAAVFHDGKKVYPANSSEAAANFAEQARDSSAEMHTGVDSFAEMHTGVANSTEAAANSTEPAKGDSIEPIADGSVETDTRDAAPYRITTLMHVRLRPSLPADIVGLAQPGTVVAVTAIVDDWMAVRNGAETVYILYGNGRYATRMTS